MNAVTQTETRAIHTAATLEVADPTKNLILVPLSQASPVQAQRAQDQPPPVHPGTGREHCARRPAAKPDRQPIRAMASTTKSSPVTAALPR